MQSSTQSSMPHFRRWLLSLGLATALAVVPLGHGAPGAAGMPDTRPSGALGASPETALSFTELYAENRELGIGDYITFDLAAHAFTRLWRDTLRVWEEATLQPRLQAAIAALTGALAQQADTPIREANQDYLKLLQALLSGAGTGLSERAAAEYALVLAAGEAASSPLFGYRMDYSQFQPRAAYADRPERQRLFRAYRYAATALFPLIPSAALGLNPETGRRLLEQLRQLAHLEADDPEVRRALTALQAGVIDVIPGQPASIDLAFVRAGTTDATTGDALALGRTLLEQARQTGRQPRVLHALVDVGALEPGLSARDVATGFRLAPLVETQDSRVFQRLVYNATGAWQGDESTPRPVGLGTIEGFGPAKVRPLVDEFVAALGLPLLREQLIDRGETTFAGYDAAWREAVALLAGGGGPEGQRLDLFRTYLAPAGADGPQRAETVKGFWTELKHAELLYQAQSYTATGKSVALKPTDAAARGATLEPAPEAWTALWVISQRAARAAPEPLATRWNALSAWLERAARLAVSVAAHGELSADDQAFLRDSPTHIDGLAGLASQPVVVDVHTGVDGRAASILHAATGFAREILVERSGQSYRGARYRFYSFSDARRWTDADWREALARIASGAGAASERLKISTRLRKAMVLDRAGQRERTAPVQVTLAEDPQAAGKLQAWVAERGQSATPAGSSAFLELPLRMAPALAQQSWVTYLDLEDPPLEPIHSFNP